MAITDELLVLVRSVGADRAAADLLAVGKAAEKSSVQAKEASASHVGMGGSLGKLSGFASTAAKTLGVGFVLAAGASVKAAMTFQGVQAQLGVAIRNNITAPAKDATRQMVEFADSLSEKGGFKASDSIQGLTLLLGATKSVTESEKDLNLATDIARARHRDLAQTVRAVALVEQGRTTGLSRLGIVLTPVKTAQDALLASTKHATVEEKARAKSLDAIATRQHAMTSLTKEFGGATAAYSHTAAGGISDLRQSVEVLSVKFGTMLLPAVEKIVQFLVALLKWVQQNKTLVLVFAGAIVVLYGSFLLLEVVTTVAEAIGLFTTALELGLGPTVGLTAALDALNLAFLADPIFWVIVAIVALVAAFIVLWVKCKWFRDFWIGLWHDIEHIVDVVIHWIEDHWKLLASIFVGIFLGPLGELVLQFALHFNQIVKFITSLPGKIVSAISSMGQKILDALLWPFKEAGKLIGKIPVIGKLLEKGLGALGSIAHGAGSVVHAITHPFGLHFQEGGAVQRTGSYIVGERGPELVTLPGGSTVTPNNALGGGGGGTIILYNVLDGKVLSKSVIRQGNLALSRS